jgi:acyl-coenzyme A thioesterase PaaI-like protein
VRAALLGPDLVCVGRCLRAGRRVAAAEAEITQEGELVAAGDDEPRPAQPG